MNELTTTQFDQVTAFAKKHAIPLDSAFAVVYSSRLFSDMIRRYPALMQLCIELAEQQGSIRPIDAVAYKAQIAHLGMYKPPTHLVRITVHTDVSDPTFFLDGVNTGTSTFPVADGFHRIEVRAPGRRPAYWAGPISQSFVLDLFPELFKPESMRKRKGKTKTKMKRP